MSYYPTSCFHIHLFICFRPTEGTRPGSSNTSLDIHRLLSCGLPSLGGIRVCRHRCETAWRAAWVSSSFLWSPSHGRLYVGVKTFKSSILTFLALLSLSPVLRTLTAATSSDSIWALSAVLFALNTLLADYSKTNVHGATPERFCIRNCQYSYYTDTMKTG
jgi:hypothetical protein